MCAQYRGGVQYHGDMINVGGYLEYRGDVQYYGGYHPLKFEYRGGYHDTCGGVQYRGVLKNKRFPPRC